MTALFVIDVQKRYMEKYRDDLVAEIGRRIRAAVEQNSLVIYVKNVRRSKGVRVVDEFADGLDVCSPHIFHKERASVFQDGAVMDLLRAHNVSTIIITGIDGNCCVASSALDARKLGYAVILPCRYIGVQNAERFEKKKTLLQKQGITILP